MGLEEVLRNPFKYRCCDKYKGTNLVFPVEYEWENYIVKMNSGISSLSNIYYAVLDQIFFSTRKISTGGQRLKAEAEKLKKLDGHYAPKLYGYKRGIILREYIFESNFRDLPNIGMQRSKLRAVINTVQEIHKRGVIIGDAHVKNFIGSKHDIGYWLDFDGVFKSLGYEHEDKALDLLKLLFSTYTAAATDSKDEKQLLTYLMAFDIRNHYKDEDVKRTLVCMLEPIKPLWKLWLSSRIPRDGYLLKVLKDVLLLDDKKLKKILK